MSTISDLPVYNAESPSLWRHQRQWTVCSQSQTNDSVIYLGDYSPVIEWNSLLYDVHDLDYLSYVYHSDESQPSAADTDVMAGVEHVFGGFSNHIEH